MINKLTSRLYERIGLRADSLKITPIAVNKGKDSVFLSKKIAIRTLVLSDHGLRVSITHFNLSDAQTKQNHIDQLNGYLTQRLD